MTPDEMLAIDLQDKDLSRRVANVERHVRRIMSERDELRDKLRRQYSRMGDPSGASSPLRAMAFALLVRLLRRQKRCWVIYDEDLNEAESLAAVPQPGQARAVLDEERVARESWYQR